MVGYVKYVLLPYIGDKFIFPVINDEVSLFETGIAIKKEKDFDLGEMFTAMVITHIAPIDEKINPELLLVSNNGNLTTKYVTFDCTYSKLRKAIEELNTIAIGTIDGVCNALNVEEDSSIIDAIKIFVNDSYVGF